MRITNQMEQFMMILVIIIVYEDSSPQSSEQSPDNFGPGPKCPADTLHGRQNGPLP